MYSNVPMSEMTPWWWTRTKPLITIPGGYGDFRKVGAPFIEQTTNTVHLRVT
jgi:hypothetical protein